MRALIFDFDGTLCDSWDAFCRGLDRYADTFRYRRVKTEEIEWLREQSSREVLKFLGIPLWKLPFVVWKMRQFLAAEVDQMQSFPGLPEVLRELHRRGYVLAVVTSNTESTVRRFLRRHGIEDCFVAVGGGTSIFGKPRALRRMLERLKFSPERAAYVGDETRDIEAASEIGLASISVAWGYNALTSLRSRNPTRLIEKSVEFLQFFP